MEREFVSYEQAVALKELGFDKDCFAGYDTFGDLWIGYNSTDGMEYNPSYYNKAPLKQQVFRWFREKYDLDSYIFWWLRKVGWGYDIRNDSSVIKQTNDNTFTSYEEAEDACIDKLIELAKQQDNGQG